MTCLTMSKAAEGNFKDVDTGIQDAVERGIQKMNNLQGRWTPIFDHTWPSSWTSVLNRF